MKTKLSTSSETGGEQESLHIQVLTDHQMETGKPQDKKNTLLKLISCFPGIRYRDLCRATKLNHGTISHHLAALEKNSEIKVLRTNNSNITRYYPVSTPLEETKIRNYLKIKTTRQIIQLLCIQKQCSFNEISSKIKKAPSTTSWNLGRLLEAEIITRNKGNDVTEYSLNKPQLIEKLMENSNNILLDRCVDDFGILIEKL